MRRIATLVLSVLALSAEAADGQTAVPGAPPDAQLVDACVVSHQHAGALAAHLSRRVESVRGVSSASDVRAAIDDVQAALNQMRTALHTCAVARDASAAVVAAPKPAAAIDHAAMGHAAPAPQAAALDPQLLGVCVQSQQQTATLADRLSRRLEMARQTNGATEMRAEVDELPTALVEVRASLQKCEPLRAAVAAAAPAAVTVPPAPMDHSKMAMGSTAPASKPGTAVGTKPAASVPMDHSKMAMGTASTAAGGEAPIKMDAPKLPVVLAERIADPACPKNVTQPNAPKAAYQRKVYYFCSTADRDLFRKDPPAYLKKHPR